MPTLVCHLKLLSLSPTRTNEQNIHMRYCRADEKVGVIEDAKFKRRDALADLAKVATK